MKALKSNNLNIGPKIDLNDFLCSLYKKPIHVTLAYPNTKNAAYALLSLKIIDINGKPTHFADEISNNKEKWIHSLKNNQIMSDYTCKIIDSNTKSFTYNELYSAIKQTNDGGLIEEYNVKSFIKILQASGLLEENQKQYSFSDDSWKNFIKQLKISNFNFVKPSSYNGIEIKVEKTKSEKYKEKLFAHCIYVEEQYNQLRKLLDNPELENVEKVKLQESFNRIELQKQILNNPYNATKDMTEGFLDFIEGISFTSNKYFIIKYVAQIKDLAKLAKVEIEKPSHFKNTAIEKEQIKNYSLITQAKEYLKSNDDTTNNEIIKQEGTTVITK